MVCSGCQSSVAWYNLFLDLVAIDLTETLHWQPAIYVLTALAFCSCSAAMEVDLLHVDVVAFCNYNVPCPATLLLLLLSSTSNIGHSPTSFADFFAGGMEQAKAFVAGGLRGHAHDIARGSLLSDKV